MSPSFAIKKGLRYRYYVSTALVQGRRTDAGSVARVAAEAIEAAVCDALAGALPDQPRPATRDDIAALVERITIGAGRITIALATSAATGDTADLITIPWSPPSRLRKREIIAVAEATASAARPIRSEARSRLIAGIARARRWLDEIMTGAIEDTMALADREGISERAVRQVLSLAFLRSDIVEAAVAGTLPRGFGLSRLTDLPSCWHEQHRVLGIAH